jgi:hypothetical protein
MILARAKIVVKSFRKIGVSMAEKLKCWLEMKSI